MINIILVDDHDLLREGIKFILSQMEAVNVIGEASNGKEFLQLLESSKLPDIVLMDITMPEMDGIEACQHAMRKYPKLKIIALSMHDQQEYYFKMIQAGAKGFVLKQAGKKELEEAIREIHSGGSHFPEDILRKIIFKFGTEEFSDDNPFNLSKREREVLALICQGHTNVEMAEKLFLSPKTIEGHRSNLLSKTGTKNSAHLVMFSIQKGIIKI
ncbi:MAG: DNA-binding response regulator [Bacteroidetes bacterium]|nr:MAG: DNA-binding response regulator [Bacteroidota bacterium]